MKKILFAILLLSAIAESCTKSGFQYPDSKIWAHRVNDIEMAKSKSSYFDGLEVDVVYSEFQKKIFVGHDLKDTINNILLDDWFNAIEKPAKKKYWIDFKNLDTDNAIDVAYNICSIMARNRMHDNVFVESYNISALKKIKKTGLRIILWTDNLEWNNLDSATWIKQTKDKIYELKPDAISNSADMAELMTNTFPEQNVHLWQTPAKLNENNAELTRKLCSYNNVKVVLVDYDKPIKN